jgi:hypothetical protein
MNTADVLPGAPPVRPAIAPLSVELPDDPAARLAEWLARTGHAGAYERFVALAVEVFPPGTAFESTVELEPEEEACVACVATVPAGTSARESYDRFSAQWARRPAHDHTAPFALLVRVARA